MTFNNEGGVRLNFPGPIGAKRRRMRSGGNVSTISNNSVHQSLGSKQEENISEEKTAQTSKCKGATTIPIFLKKTYKMVDTCDPSIASWTDEGDMFVVKDPEVFATQVIPQYFDHNKFSSFARQLNFYGFRKMQSKPIRNSDFDAETAKHVTFFNENFKRGRCDLLKKIQRSTRGGGSTNPQDQSREIQLLRDQISNLEMKMVEVEAATEERVRRLELDLLARMDQMMMNTRQHHSHIQQQQPAVPHQVQLEKSSSVGTANSGSGSGSSNQHQMQQHAMLMQQQGNHLQNQTSMNPQALNGLPNNWDPNGFSFNRGNSISSVVSASATQYQQQQQQIVPTNMGATATLPPHPKQKLLPLGGMPGMMGAPPDRMNSLRGISSLTRGLSGLSRGASVESAALFDENMFNLFMMDNNDQQGSGNESALQPTPIQDQQNMMYQQQALQKLNGLLPMFNANDDQYRNFNGTVESANDREDLSDVSNG